MMRWLYAISNFSWACLLATSAHGYMVPMGSGIGIAALVLAGIVAIALLMVIIYPIRLLIRKRRRDR